MSPHSWSIYLLPYSFSKILSNTFSKIFIFKLSDLRKVKSINFRIKSDYHDLKLNFYFLAISFIIVTCKWLLSNNLHNYLELKVWIFFINLIYYSSSSLKSGFKIDFWLSDKTDFKPPSVLTLNESTGSSVLIVTLKTLLEIYSTFLT